MKEGFYRCDMWPYHFMVNDRGILWGFSIWKNKPGYRTFGAHFSEWQVARLFPPVEPDHDRTLDKEFLREYRAKMKAEKPPTELDRLRAANKRLEAALAEIEVAVDDVDHEMHCTVQPIHSACSCGVQKIRDAIEAAKVTT